MSKGRVKGGKNTRTAKRWDNGVGRSMVFDVSKLSVGPYVPAQQLQAIQRLLTSAYSLLKKGKVFECQDHNEC